MGTVAHPSDHAIHELEGTCNHWLQATPSCATREVPDQRGARAGGKPFTGVRCEESFMKWEYTTVMFEAARWFLGGKLDGQAFNDRLNRLGDEGWELVSVFDTNFTQGGTRDVVAVLKRPKK